jgi:hypothetical protein
VKKLGKSGENGGKLGKHGANVREKDGKPQGSRWNNQGFDHLIRPKIYGFWILWDSTGISTAIVENWVQRWQKRVGKGVVPAKFIFWGVCIPCESYIHIYIFIILYIYIIIYIYIILYYIIYILYYIIYIYYIILYIYT